MEESGGRWILDGGRKGTSRRPNRAEGFCSGGWRSLTPVSLVPPLVRAEPRGTQMLSYEGPECTRHVTFGVSCGCVRRSAQGRGWFELGCGAKPGPGGGEVGTLHPPGSS